MSILALVGLLAACQSKQQGEATAESNTENTTETVATTEQETPTEFGESVDEAAAISLTDLETMMAEKELAEGVVVSGKVTAVCQKKGCWMTLEKPNGDEMRVTFKDYALFMPFDLAGKEVVIRGKAEKSVTPVEDLKHFAEDAGKSAEEIAAITEDEINLKFEADGVVIKQ